MTRFSAFFGVAVLLLLTACGPDKAAMLEYNKTLVAIQTKLIAGENDFHASLTNHQLAEMETGLFDLRSLAIKSRKEVKDLTVPIENGSKVKEALISLCDAYHDLCDNQFKEAIAFLGIPDGKYTDVQKEKVDALFTTASNLLNERNNSFIDAQTEFWTANNLGKQED